MNPNTIMHTTTKKNLGRSTRAGVVGRSSVSSPLCAPVASRGRLHTRSRARSHVCTCGRAHAQRLCVRPCPCVLVGQRVVQTRVYQRGTLLPWTRSKLPVRHFVSAILFARYLAGYFDLDALRSLRYLFVCTYVRLGPLGTRANASRIGRRARRDFGAKRRVLPRGNYFFRERRDARNCRRARDRACTNVAHPGALVNALFSFTSCI